MFGKIKKIHFVGIGGIGMSGIAEVLLNMGYTVSGSDLKLSEVTEHLQQLGARIVEGHRPENVGQAGVVVTSSAVQEENPEVRAARASKIPVIRRAEMLAELMRLKHGIAIAGTHGKTTTTSMVGQVLTSAGLDPTLVIGGKVRYLGTNAKLGTGQYLVAEADEFDRSFLRLAPVIAVITTIEAEHLDCYKDLDEIKNAFVEFANKVPFYGAIIACLDERGVQSILPRLEKRCITYGLSSQAELQAREVRFNGMETGFAAHNGTGKLGEIKLKVPGLHNVKNALAAIAVGLEMEIPFATIAFALAQFAGVYRRFEIKGERDGALVIDDYGHHPTEIEATLKAAKDAFSRPRRRVVAVFQPHLYTRTRDFFRDFGASFYQADVLMVTDIYPAREQPIAGVTGELVAQAARALGHRQVIYVHDKNDIPRRLAAIVKPDDIVITLGAGDIYKYGEAFLRI
ncbi:MAG: UDP-N-acetylmuramate--L-alanine ligase [Candidatus Edwardsbacteria bacterium]|nr:UDP-N-acetylmuramate--L-alanine ligase [Candidatus Edwardsbacteria bacterium]